MASIQTDLGFEIGFRWRERKGHYATVIEPEGRVVKAGTVPVDAQGNVVLVRQADGLGWTLPKGHVERPDAERFATSFMRALSRTATQETLEEAGRYVSVEDYLDFVDVDKPDGHGYRAYFFSARVDACTALAELETAVFPGPDAEQLITPEFRDVVALAIAGRSLIPAQVGAAMPEQLAFAL